MHFPSPHHTQFCVQCDRHHQKLIKRLKRKEFILSGATKKSEAKQIGHQDFETTRVTKNRPLHQSMSLHASNKNVGSEADWTPGFSRQLD